MQPIFPANTEIKLRLGQERVVHSKLVIDAVSYVMVQTDGGIRYTIYPFLSQGAPSQGITEFLVMDPDFDKHVEMAFDIWTANVVEYMDQYARKPLRFSDDGDKYLLDLESSPIEEKVLMVLALARLRSSDSLNGVRETYEGKKRSLCDIYRHLMGIYPDINVFDIARILNNLHIQSYNNNYLISNYCGTVMRRVFSLAGKPYTTYPHGRDEFMGCNLFWEMNPDLVKESLIQHYIQPDMKPIF